MISVVYIELENQKLALQLKVIRHFLLHAWNRDTRDVFIAEQLRDYTQGMKQYLEQKPDHDFVNDIVAPLICSRHERWLTANLHHLIEFSENRLTQMELILRYALFESFLVKTVGNILWEYPVLQKCPIHKKMAEKSIARFKRKLIGNPNGERIAWTKAVVDAVDKLRFAKWKDEKTNNSTPYLWQYLRYELGLEFGQEKMCASLEWVRRVRNHLTHHSLELTLLNERTTEAEKSLANFPVSLVQAASKLYPKACTEDPPEEDDDGTPSYIVIAEYF
jgi:hypothetical protein